MSMPQTQIETERLILRVPRIEDFERYAELFGHESSTVIGGPHSRADAWRRFLQMPGAWLLQGFAMFSVIEKSSGLWIGQAGPWYPDGWPGTEVGYAFHQDAHGKGYATEACVAAMDYAFDMLGWDDVIHSIRADNVPSQKVAIRLGAINRGSWGSASPQSGQNIEIWGQTREQWAKNRPSVIQRDRNA
jgi:RimJ/RimL family protein N-acetyltransferase